MKPPIKAIKKIIKFCKTKDYFECCNCELFKFCESHFRGIPYSHWIEDYNKLKKEVHKYDR